MFIHSITLEIKTSFYLLFADDLKIYAQIDDIRDSHNLQTDLSNLHNWSVNNKLSFNIKKCNILSFSRKKTLGN